MSGPNNTPSVGMPPPLESPDILVIDESLQTSEKSPLLDVQDTEAPFSAPAYPTRGLNSVRRKLIEKTGQVSDPDTPTNEDTTMSPLRLETITDTAEEDWATMWKGGKVLSPPN